MWSLRARIFLGSPDDDYALMKFSIQHSVELAFARSQLQTTPVLVGTTNCSDHKARTGTTVTPECQQCLFPLTSPGFSLLCSLRTAISPVLVVLWWETQAPFSLGSGLFLSSLFHSYQVETQMTVPNTFRLVSWQRDPCKPLQILEGFLSSLCIAYISKV